MIHDLYERISQFESSVGYYLGGMKEEHLKESESKRIILGTYAMASEGLDIKTLTTLYLATPKTDVCQSVGRILRSKDHKPVVVDFIDETGVFENQYQKRKKYYLSKGYLIEEYENYRSYFEDKPIPVKKSKPKSAKKNDVSVCLIQIPDT